MFRVVKFRGDLRVKYTDGQGNVQYWVKNQAELLSEIQGILKIYANQNIVMTNRQLYYQLVSRDIIPNADEIYKRICTFLTDARYGGFIDWESIEDRGRVPSKASEWDDVKDLIESSVYAYRLPRWSDQGYYVELFCEKQAMESVLKPISKKYHIYFGVNKGYSSASTMYDLAKRIKEQIMNGKKAVVLYLGDHDASGLDMIRDIRERITEFLTKGNNPVENDWNDDEALDDIKDKFDVVQLALNMEQIKKYNPPPNPAKMTDPRAKWYIKQFGNKSWELDALEPKVLIRIAEDGILEFLDLDKYNAWIERENKEKQALKEFGEKLLKKESKKKKKGDD